MAPGEHVREGEVPRSPKALANPPVDPELEGADAEPEPEPEAAAPEEEAALEGDDASIETWDELAQHFSSDEFEISPDELLGHIQIEGREGEGLVPIAEAVQFYRENQGLDLETEAAVARVEQELRADVDTRMEEMAAATQRMIAHIEQIGRVDPALRESNPQEWIRQTEAVRALNVAVEQSLEVMSKEANKREQSDSEMDAKWTAEQVAITYRNHPEWRDAAVGQAAMKEIAAYARKIGFTDEQIKGFRAANVIEGLWGAAQWQKLQDNAPAARKVLRGLPRKNLRVSARNEAAPREAQDKARQATLGRFQQSGKIEDALSLFEEHI